MARKIYLRQGIGIGGFQKIYGGRKRNGSRPPHFCKSSGAVACNILQQLQAMNILDVDPKGGRVVTFRNETLFGEAMLTFRNKTLFGEAMFYLSNETLFGEAMLTFRKVASSLGSFSRVVNKLKTAYTTLNLPRTRKTLLAKTIV